MLHRLPSELRIPLAVVIVCIGVGWAREPAAGDGTEAFAWAQAAYLVIAVGLSLLAGKLLGKNDALIRDERPTALATRGTFVPVLKGRRRLGYVFGWAGNRTSHSRVAAGSGKGSLADGKPRETAYNEDGWHLICIGPAQTLWEIDENGVILLKGPITKDTHPSGSTISLGNKAGDMRIFWGESDQPINTWLGSDGTGADPVNRVGIESRWPGLCYIEWRGKALGTQQSWPQLTYVFETTPQTNHLTHTPQVIVTDKVPISAAYWGGLDPQTGLSLPDTPYQYFWRPDDVVPGASGGDPGAFFDVLGHFPTQFQPSSQGDGEVYIVLVGNSDAASNKSYVCDSAATFGTLDPASDHYTRYYLKAGETIPASITTSGSGIGRVQIMVDGFTGGWNGSHLIASLLFDPWPNGLGLPTANWDLDSFDAFAAIMSTEDLRCSTLAKEGRDVRAVLGGLMQDLGVTISRNPRTAKLELIPWREPTGTLPNIPDEAIVRRVKRELQLGPRKVDRLVFQFSDEFHSFRDMTIHVDDDGQARRREFYSQQVTPITATSHYASAAQIAQRRAAEEMSKAHVFRLYSNRAARSLKPGEPIVVEGFDEVMRITAVQFDPLSGEVQLDLMNDFYGATLSDFIQPQGKIFGGSGEIGPYGLRAVLVEIPEVLIGAGGPQTVSLLPIRTSSGVSGHNLFISRDDATYTSQGFDAGIYTGGVLLDDVLVDEEWLQDEGPTFDVIGDDIGDVLDLSADETSWRNGRQLAIFQNASGEQEICFLKKVTLVSGTTYRLDGLIRARYDTSPISLTAANNPVVVIAQNDEGLAIQDVLLEPSVTLYGKAVPFDATPADVAPIDISLYGKGVRPLPVTNIRLDQGSAAAGSGNTDWTDFTYVVNGSSPADDLDIVWGYKTPQAPGTGAGEFNAGTIQLDPSPEGDFIVEILDSGDVVKRTTSSATPSWTYTRADRLVDFTSEPTLFKVRITQTRGGQLSDTTTQTISKI